MNEHKPHIEDFIPLITEAVILLFFTTISIVGKASDNEFLGESWRAIPFVIAIGLPIAVTVTAANIINKKE